MALLVALACGGAALVVARPLTAQVATAGVVDSVFPIEEEIRRFQATLPEQPEGLSGGETSLEMLVRRFVRAVEAGDPQALAPLVLTPSEFGWLYYPHTRFTRAPYQLSPSLLWFQIQNTQSRSLTRLFRRFGGNPLGFRGFRCAERPATEGPNRVRDDCVVLLAGEEGDEVPLRLFGTVVERDGIFKFVSLSNAL